MIFLGIWFFQRCMLKMVYFKNQNFKRIVNFILNSLLRKKVLTIKKSVKISSILWYYFKDQVCKYLEDNSFTEYWYAYLISSLMPVIGYLWMYQNNIWSRINDQKYSLLFPWTWAWGKDFKTGHFKNTWHCNSNPEVKNNNG